MKRCLILLTALLIFFAVPLTAISSEPKKKQVGYHEIHPDIITNLDQESSNSLIPTLMIRVTLMTQTVTNTYILLKHEALYLNKMLLFINKHKKSQLNNRIQKKKFKRAIKNIINTTLNDELKQPQLVTKVLFTRMVID